MKIYISPSDINLNFLDVLDTESQFLAQYFAHSLDPPPSFSFPLTPPSPLLSIYSPCKKLDHKYPELARMIRWIVLYVPHPLQFVCKFQWHTAHPLPSSPLPLPPLTSLERYTLYSSRAELPLPTVLKIFMQTLYLKE